jgi:hypothetical protein
VKALAAQRAQLEIEMKETILRSERLIMARHNDERMEHDAKSREEMEAKWGQQVCYLYNDSAQPHNRNLLIVYALV